MFIPYNYNITTTHKPLHCMVIAKKGKSGKELKDEAKKRGQKIKQEMKEKKVKKNVKSPETRMKQARMEDNEEKK